MGGITEAEVQPPPVQEKQHPAELQALLSTMPNERGREAMTTAFYTVCEGDPKSPLVQQAIFTRGHLRTMIGHVASFQLIASTLKEDIQNTVDLPRFKKLLEDHDKRMEGMLNSLIASSREVYAAESQSREVQFKQWNDGIVILDGAMGTVIRACEAAEKAIKQGHTLMWMGSFLAGIGVALLIQWMFHVS